MRISKWAMACGLFALVLGGGVFALVVVTGDSDRSKPASSAAAGDEGGEGGEKEDQPGEADAQRYRAEAFPKRNVTSARTKSARRAAARVPTRLTKSDFRRGALARDGRSTAVALRLSQPWVALGPAGGRLDPQIQHLQNALPLTSGRITAVVSSPSCVSGDCRMWLAAADGGVWRTDDALADPPTWTSIDS